MAQNKLEIIIDSFWNSPNHFNNIPMYIQKEIKDQDILISKGDANYRRFYEDRDIPISFEGAIQVCKQQFVLRTLKSQILGGTEEQKVKTIAESDESWMINGKYAIIKQVL